MTPCVSFRRCKPSLRSNDDRSRSRDLRRSLDRSLGRYREQTNVGKAYGPSHLLLSRDNWCANLSRSIAVVQMADADRMGRSIGIAQSEDSPEMGLSMTLRVS